MKKRTTASERAARDARVEANIRRVRELAEKGQAELEARKKRHPQPS